MRELRLESFALEERPEQARQFHIVVNDEYPHGSNVSWRSSRSWRLALLFTYVYTRDK